MQDEDLRKLTILGERIQKLRKQKKLTLSELCYKNGLEPSTLSRIEKAIVEPKYLTLLKIAEAFSMDISDLLKF
jgi:transcriptional regulator with XRE-family HTH domain